MVSATRVINWRTPFSRPALFTWPFSFLKPLKIFLSFYLSPASLAPASLAQTAKARALFNDAQDNGYPVLSFVKEQLAALYLFDAAPRDQGPANHRLAAQKPAGAARADPLLPVTRSTAFSATVFTSVPSSTITRPLGSLCSVPCPWFPRPQTCSAVSRCEFLQF